MVSRRLILIAWVLATAALVAGCGGGGESRNQGTPAPSSSPDASVADGNQTPVPTAPPDFARCQQTGRLSNGTLLAIELLSSESDEVVLDEHDVTEKAAEIDGALARVFEIAPELATTRVSPTRVPGNVIVGAGGELAAAFSDIDVSPPIHTGNQAFDELGERLGLWAVNGGSVILLCVSDFVNIERAVEAYAGIRGVRYAESNGIVRIPEDQSDIQATPSGSEWHILISPRCYPDFCPDRFFVVSSGGVREMNTATAQ